MEGIHQLASRVDEEVAGHPHPLHLDPGPPAHLHPQHRQRQWDTAPGGQHRVEEVVVRVVVVVDIATDALGDRDDPAQGEMGGALDAGGQRVEAGHDGALVDLGAGETGQEQVGLGQAIVLDQLGEAVDGGDVGHRLRLGRLSRPGSPTDPAAVVGAASPSPPSPAAGGSPGYRTAPRARDGPRSRPGRASLPPCR